MILDIKVPVKAEIRAVLAAEELGSIEDVMTVNRQTLILVYGVDRADMDTLEDHLRESMGGYRGSLEIQEGSW
jgi:hypothetical protein